MWISNVTNHEESISTSAIAKVARLTTSSISDLLKIGASSVSALSAIITQLIRIFTVFVVNHFRRIYIL